MNKKRLLIILLMLFLSISILVSCNNEESNYKRENQSGKDKENVELIFSAAASLTDVLEELKDEYIKDNPNVDIKYTFDSSGTLQTQIEERAPVDIFFSAADKQMDVLEEKDLLVDGSRKTMLKNTVVLIVPKDTNIEIKSFEDLKNEDIKKIAIGDPEFVPVGQYSKEIFDSLDLTSSIMDKVIFGNNVRTVLTWVEEGEVDCGLVYATDAYTTDDVEIVVEAPEDSYKDVTYPIAIINDSDNVKEAERFIEFLSNKKSQEVFKSYGFDIGQE
ncbi:MAG TPA: molybdate ABC transporter substrate-binding protein [Tissierellaceae bacterium]|nr:molybdate ABC transporter substrate-binding protein [Tissierellaceae bacterium]